MSGQVERLKRLARLQFLAKKLDGVGIHDHKTKVVYKKFSGGGTSITKMKSKGPSLDVSGRPTLHVRVSDNDGNREYKISSSKAKE